MTPPRAGVTLHRQSFRKVRDHRNYFQVIGLSVLFIGPYTLASLFPQQPLGLRSDPRRLGRRELVVHTVQEAYDIVGVRPEDFTECLIWPCEWVSRS